MKQGYLLPLLDYKAAKVRCVKIMKLLRKGHGVWKVSHVLANILFAIVIKVCLFPQHGEDT